MRVWNRWWKIYSGRQCSSLIQCSGCTLIQPQYTSVWPPVRTSKSFSHQVQTLMVYSAVKRIRTKERPCRHVIKMKSEGCQNEILTRVFVHFLEQFLVVTYCIPAYCVAYTTGVKTMVPLKCLRNGGRECGRCDVSRSSRSSSYVKSSLETLRSRQKTETLSF